MPRRRRFRPNLPLWGAWALFLGLIVAYIGLGTVATMLSPVRTGLPKSPYLIFLARSLDATLAVWFFAVGSSIGSFLNVVAYRLPRGRTLGGHSACPYCCTTIAAGDNVPVFAWLALRGRCRACRLPISIQYPLVELAMGLLFLVMYFVEFGIAGSNLPGSTPRPLGIGLVWMQVSSTLLIRMLLFLFLLSGVVSVALIIIRRSFPPLSLYVCLVVVIVAAQLIHPRSIVVPWEGMTKLTGAQSSIPVIPSHVDVLLTAVCGGLSGFLVALLTLPLIGSASNRWAWLGVAVCAGVLFGWQSMPSVAVCILLASLAGGWMTVGRFPLEPTELGFRTLFDPALWSWLGLVVYRAAWRSMDQWLRSLPVGSDWLAQLLPLAVLLPLAWLVGRSGAHAARDKLQCRSLNVPLGHQPTSASGC